ncbi:MAG: ABC transporter permease [Pseudomonadota bacterium]
MNFTTWVALRYLMSRRAGRYAPLLTATAVASVALGMLALILVMSVMRGFRQELASRLLGFNAHITLSRSADAGPLARDDVEALVPKSKLRDAAPFVQGEIIAQSAASGELLAQGARVRGIEPDWLGAMGKVRFYFPEDSAGFDSLKALPGGLPGAIIGNEVVAQLSVHPDFGDRVDLVAPLAEVGPTGELTPNERRFAVTGVFLSGVFDYDSKYILVALSEAKRLLGEQAEEGWQIRLTDAANVAGILSSMKAKLPAGWKAEGWNEQNRKLFAALKLERTAMAGVLIMVMLIASFAIVGVVLLLTAAKRKDIAILEAIGLTERGVGRIFIAHAALIGAAGSLIGLVAGLGICFALERYPIRLPASYYLDWLPVDTNPVAAVAFALVGVAIAVVSSIYPVRQAMKLSPVEVLRYE